jgi:imidazoleglycerol phosphate synthase glutamine amidotransferase subunit HisH
MTIKGSVWDRDKVKTKRFEETIPIMGWNDVKQI